MLLKEFGGICQCCLALVKQIQHLNEQCTTFILSEKFDLIDHLLYCAQCCSMLLYVA